MTISPPHQPAGAARPAAAAASLRPGRGEEAFERARRHSGRVRVFKLLLPVAAMLMIVAFVGRSWLAVPEGVSINLGGSAVEGGRLVMADPRLDGFTRDDRPYTMTAARAIQDLGDDSRIDLERIDAKLPFDDHSWLTVAARTGVLDRDANTLGLDEEVTFVTDTGITARLRSAVVDIGAGSLDTDEPVDITLDGGRIQADSMTVRDNGAVLIFERRVRMDLDAGRLQTAASSEGETHGN